MGFRNKHNSGGPDENYNNSLGQSSSCRLGHLGAVQTEHRGQKTPAIKGNNDQPYSAVDRNQNENPNESRLGLRTS
jgi:hypothetical protein